MAITVPDRAGIDNPRPEPYSGAMNRHFPLRALAVCLSGLALSACGGKKTELMTVWTDRSEFVAYAELFNASQSQYKAVVEYRENPAQALINTDSPPDVIVGPWLKGEKARAKLIPLDYLFNEIRINQSLFYRPLLELGNVKGRQYLLPVSFNLPAVIFSKDRQAQVTDNFFISLDKIKELSREFNAEKNGTVTRMGFSPRWNPEFLYILTRMFGAQYEEGGKLFSWNAKGLSEAMNYVRDWSETINGSQRAEDDYQFKNLYDPPYRQVTSGRCMFSYVSSRDLLILPADKVASIDFRWITRNELTPVDDGMIYLGICKKAQRLEAAEAFLIWFYGEKNQRAMLQRKADLGLMDRNFGIADGFSSLRPVNEKIFPLFYPNLLGHLPALESLMAPRILPNDWDTLKDGILMPWLTETLGAPEQKAGAKPGAGTLESRIQDWQKAN